MGRGNRRHVSREKKEEIARLSLDLSLKMKDIAAAVGVSHQTVNRTLNKWRDKGLEVREHNGWGRPAALRHAELDYLEQRHKEEPTVELHVLQHELRDRFNIEVHPTTISRYRLKLGLVQVDPERLRAQEKKEEQRRAEALQKLAERKLPFAEVNKVKRNAFLSRVHGYNPRTLVFIDEIIFSDPYIPLASKKSAPAATLHDWAKAHKRRHTVHLALTVNGLLDFSLASPRSSSFRQAFRLRTVSFLRPFPLPQSVLIAPSSAMYDSLKGPVAARGAKLLRLPHYAFDLNPLTRAAQLVQEWAFRQRQNAKSLQEESHIIESPDLRHNSPNGRMDLLFDGLCQIGPEVAWDWLKESGYNVHP